VACNIPRKDTSKDVPKATQEFFLLPFSKEVSSTCSATSHLTMSSITSSTTSHSTATSTTAESTVSSTISWSSRYSIAVSQQPVQTASTASLAALIVNVGSTSDNGPSGSGRFLVTGLKYRCKDILLERHVHTGYKKLMTWTHSRAVLSIVGINFRRRMIYFRRREGPFKIKTFRK